MVTLTIVLAACGLALAWVKWRSTRHPPLPPGPPALPIIGHLLSIPVRNQDMFFRNLGKEYGDVVHLHILGRSMVILNSMRAAVDLLDKRSTNYSGRPDFPVFELMGWSPTLVFLQYGTQLRLHRRMLQQYLSRDKCTEYRPIQTREARILVRNLASNPDRREWSISRYSTAIIMELAYGHQITSDKDPYIRMAEEVRSAISAAGAAGGNSLDFFPFLRYFPSWFPGTYYARVGRDKRAIVRKLHEYPFKEVREQMAEGIIKPSFLASQLEKFNHEGAENNSIEDIQGAAGVMYIGGAETTSSSLLIFLLAMVLYPECQVRAQEEIDAVVGPGRLPEFSDRDSLPYLECILQETLRWNTAAPSGVPHRSVEDDVYNGMFIPKGSIIIANTKGMILDETVYADPRAFNPTRFLPKPEGNGEPYLLAAFGFGRRVCVGRHLGDSSLWIAIATILATLTIAKAIDDDGKEIIPEVAFINGIASHPVPFPCHIKPRNNVAQSLAETDIPVTY